VRPNACTNIEFSYAVSDYNERIVQIVSSEGGGRRRHVLQRQFAAARTNPRYHRLIETYRDLTGVPMVLNTSFNKNEPVVCEPEHALDCFLRTKMDVLVMGDTFISRHN
jgi:predicted NodU family carbamoyl transferase